MKPFFSFKASASGAALSIYDEIFSTHAAAFRTALDAVKGSTLTVEINSPGGDVFAGLAIYNMLKGSGKIINVNVAGIAASAASVIAMAGTTISMPSNSFMMIHNPITGVYGNAADLRESADVLDKIGAALLAIYVSRTGMPADKMKELLAAETWLTADEAVSMKFATVVTDAIEARASFDMGRADLPAHVKAVFKPLSTPTPHAAVLAAVQPVITPSTLWAHHRRTK
ncbi:head maturation protease, ClpP-related [Variovorax humicola]|uniref:ATP-dependent Clp protease proteolytic subunit n=1 Tax=Variovorax humicola TaxID=1769758 RepID=A0ABU8VUF5_9BURK